MMYRSPKEIMALFELCIDSYFEHSKQILTDDEQKLLDKLREWKLKLEPQVMHLFESPMSNKDFKDIFTQMFNPVIESVIDQAKADGIVTPYEQRLLDHVVEKLKIH